MPPKKYRERFAAVKSKINTYRPTSQAKKTHNTTTEEANVESPSKEKKTPAPAIKSKLKKPRNSTSRSQDGDSPDTS